MIGTVEAVVRYPRVMDGSLMSRCFSRLLAAALGVLAYSGAVAAQSLPPSVAPGRLEQRFERPATPQSLPPVEFPAPEQAPAPDKAGAIRLVLRDLVFDGGTVYAAAELLPLYQSLLGQQISLLDLYKVRDAITAKYRSEGYVLSLAVIPAQRIAGGVVHMALVEGYVSVVRFEGPYTDGFGILNDYARRIREARPLRSAVLERYVMLMDDLPGISVHTVLKPAKSGEAGSDLTVVIERKPVGANVTLDNRGTPSVGPFQLDASVDLNDQFGVFDQTSIRGIIAPHVDELRYLDLSHTELLGLDGTTLVVGARRNWSIPGSTVAQYGIKSESSTLHTGLAYPLIRSRSETLRLTGDFTLRNSWTHANGAPISTDRVRMVSFGTSWDISDSWQGSNLFQAGFGQAVGGMGAYVSDKSRLDTQLTFSKVTASAQRVQPLPGNFSVLLAADSQYTPNKLVSAEQFGVGGKTYGRGFDSSAITGDKGASYKGELQYTPGVEATWLKYVQLYGFGDYGKTWNYVDDRSETFQYLGSAGGGLRLGLGERVSGNVEFTTPLTWKTTTNENPGSRVYFSLSARY